MATITINNPSGVNLYDLTTHRASFAASSVTSTTITVKYTDGWEVVASGAFEYYADMQYVKGKVSSFQVLRPGGVAEFSATLQTIEDNAGPIALATGVTSNQAMSFTVLIQTVMSSTDINGSDPAIIGGAGNDSYFVTYDRRWTMDGGSGTDTVKYSMRADQYVIQRTDSGVSVDIVYDPNGTYLQTLTNVERLQFNDKTIALDVTPEGNTGKAMGFLGTVAPTLMNDTSIRGLIISLFDQGQTMESLSQLALDQHLLPTNSNLELANAVYHNVLGGAASTEMTNALVGFIEAHGQAKFLATVAGLHINVDLVGLQQTGVEYLI